MYLRELFTSLDQHIGKEVMLQGWIRNHRKQKKIGFIDMYDGTIFDNIQLVYDQESTSDFESIKGFTVGSSIQVICDVKKNQKDTIDIAIKKAVLLGECDEDYPIQPKPHSMEFLRKEAHLRTRTNLFRAIFRVRNAVSMAIHTYFQSQGFLYVHTPLLTTSDCEGGDQMFKATALDLKNPPLKDNIIDMSQDLFGKQTYLTGTGQLHGEALAMAFTNIYTFGPTFRTEKSNTKVHVNEFWMIEPEMSFCNLEKLMDIEEESIKFIIKTTLEQCAEEMKFLDKFVSKGLLEKLNITLTSTSIRLTYAKAIEILKLADEDWEFIPTYGEDLAKEHERYLTESYFHSPIFVTDWPKDLKPYYCKLNEDKKTVASVDYILPNCGELSSGSRREEDYDILSKRMDELGLDKDQMQWYLDLRRFGTTERAGFGIGLERLLIYITGVENVRDVIPFPRTPNSCNF